MRLYIANCSNQNQLVHIRIPEMPKVFQKVIEIGRQESIAGDLNPKQVEAIITQMERYGLVAAEKVKSSKHRIPYIYSVDKPVSAEAILKAGYHNRGVLIDEGKDARKKAAIAANNAVEAASEQEAPIKALDVEIEEDDTTGDRLDGETPVREGFHVEKDGPEKRAPRQRRPRNRG